MATVVAFVPAAWPALAIGVGAIAAALTHAVGEARRTRYALVGTAYCLGLAAVAWPGGLPALSGSPWRALATVGALGLLGVGAGLLVRRAIGGLPAAIVPTDARSVPGTVRRGVRLAGTIRTAVAVGGNIARLGGAVIAGTVVTLLVGIGAFLLDALGVSAALPWFGGATVNAVHLWFVLSVLVGFWLLAGVHALALAVATGVDAGREARDRVAATREDDVG